MIKEQLEQNKVELLRTLKQIEKSAKKPRKTPTWGDVGDMEQALKLAQELLVFLEGKE